MSESEYYAFLESRGATFYPVPENELIDYIQRLQGMETLHAVPHEQLEWLVRASKLFSLDVGSERLRPGDPTDDMWLILEGEIQVYLYQNGQKKVQASSGPGVPGGYLPFSRMKVSPIYAEVISPLKALALHKSRFHELVGKNYELTEAIVHSMTDRVRHFSALHFQNEKLMSLGKLSAGIAHELNNPAAAIVRSAEDLKATVGSLPQGLTTAASLSLSTSELRALKAVLTQPKVPSARIPLLERKRREEEITDWLDDKNLPSDAAETFLAFGFTTRDLDSFKTIVTEQSFPAFLEWLSRSLRAERSVEEIGTAARRISELVQSVKSYTRMDQVQDMQELCINDGIRNTITMLQHKMRKNSVSLHEELAAGLPLIVGFPGELNQVWTNIIDNALDAMKEGGELAVSTFSDAERVIFRVVDSGLGIAPENLERIFDPFFTTKDVGEGTGVGLDVVQKVVTLHKGKIEVTSKPGRTEFHVAFPRERFNAGWKLKRDPYLLETCCTGIFAAGDVRSGAMNRVASAVGEGAMAVSFVHQYLAEV